MPRLVVISPHLDDAVFSAGTFIAAIATVCPVLIVTVCAGVPADDVPVGGYDELCGFATAAAAMRARRAEDTEAAAVLGADVLHLSMLDDQYDRDKTPERIQECLAPVLATAGKFLSPLGIRHPDHLLVARAMRGRAHYVYEDLPYRALYPEEMPAVMGATRLLELPSSETKVQALRCYRSQIGDQQVWALGENERIHRVRWTA